MSETECLVCRNGADGDAPVREQIVRAGGWRVAHAFDAALRGWLIVAPLRHVAALDELDESEAAALGPLLRGLTTALRQVTGCVKTYVMLLAEQEGFAHLHLHVVPRAADLDPALRGARIFALLGADAAHRIPDAEQDEIASQLRAALTAVATSRPADLRRD